MACCSINLLGIAIRAFLRFLPCLAILIWFISGSYATEIDDFKKSYRTGDYASSISLAATQVERGVYNEVWPRMLVESYLAVGDYPAALKAYEKAIER